MGDYLDSPQQYARAVCSALKHRSECLSNLFDVTSHIYFCLCTGEDAQSQSHDAITEEERTSNVPPGISGRLVVRESVLWHNHALVTPGRRRVTARIMCLVLR